MRNTREEILQVSLRLFARDGYEAVSVSRIAGELGITKGALYRHYASKRAIFDSILARMEDQDRQQAEHYDVPPDSYEADRTAYEKTSVPQIIAVSKAMFRYWTEDDFAANFRKLLTLEQHRDPEMMALYQQYLAAGPFGYLTDLLTALQIPDPREAALRLYGPMFLFYALYDGSADPQSVLHQFDAYLDTIQKTLEEFP